jgi:hypothetical protein
MLTFALDLSAEKMASRLAMLMSAMRENNAAITGRPPRGTLACTQEGDQNRDGVTTSTASIETAMGTLKPVLDPAARSVNTVTDHVG